MKKTLRKILTFVLVLVVTLSFTSTVYAAGGDYMPMAGTETWYKGGGLVGSFTLVGTNKTPVKTMGDSGKLRVYGTAYTDNGGIPWQIKIQIIDYNTEEVLNETVSIYPEDSGQVFSVSYDVVKGQQLQIYMYYIKKPSPYAYIDLCYDLR